MPETQLPPKTPETAGRWIRLPRSRRLVVDLLKFSKKVPSQPLVRNCNVKELVALRKQAMPKISWPAMFMKAYSIMSTRHPNLRRLFMPWPWAHLHEHPYSIGRMTVAREYEGEEWVLFCRIVKPETLSLAELQEQMLEAKNKPVEEVTRFRMQLVFSKLPTFLRRFAWWYCLNVSGYTRATTFGTFGMTTVSSLGGISIHPPSTGATTMTFGPTDPEGNVRVTLCYDHRLLDGAEIARYLRELEEILNGEIADELRSMIEADGLREVA